MTLTRLLDTTPPSLLTTAACSGLRPEPDCRPRRTYLHLSYSYASPFGPAILVTHDPQRSLARLKFCTAVTLPSISEHEHIPEIAAAALASYLRKQPHNYS